ncbi:translation initiation factor IF-2-like [Lynx rufus]|uniref:translation initiation factor IF-2-like n=1 Tax=Lynx rufus TaxID=61384 RepID=UPI001F12585C|nr:translation initiation factor IF-2-like [Lynx rufus]
MCARAGCAGAAGAQCPLSAALRDWVNGRTSRGPCRGGHPPAVARSEARSAQRSPGAAARTRADPPARAPAVSPRGSPARPADRQPDPAPTLPPLWTLAAPSGDRRFPATETSGSGASTGSGALLLLALGACLPLPERAWGAPSRAPPLPSAAFPGPAERHRGRVPAEGLPQGPERMNGKGTGEPGCRARPLGVALRSLERRAAGPRRSRERKLVATSLEVASARVAVPGRKAERAPGTSERPAPGPETSCPKALSHAFPICDSSSGGPADFSAFRPWRPTSEEARVRSPVR